MTFSAAGELLGLHQLFSLGTLLWWSRHLWLIAYKLWPSTSAHQLPLKACSEHISFVSFSKPFLHLCTAVFLLEIKLSWLDLYAAIHQNIRWNRLLCLLNFNGLVPKYSGWGSDSLCLYLIVLNLYRYKEQILASVQGGVSAHENEYNFVSASLKIHLITGNWTCSAKISFPVLDTKIMTTLNVLLVLGHQMWWAS